MRKHRIRTGHRIGRKLLSSSTGSRVLDSRLRSASQGLFSVTVTLCLFALFLLISDHFKPGWWKYTLSGGQDVNFSLLVLSLLMLGLIAIRRIPAPILLDIGLVYEFLYCFGVSYGEIARIAAPGTPLEGLSLVAVIILLFPLFVPYPFRKVMLVTLLAALTGPAAATIYYSIRGWPDEGGWVLFSYIPTFVAVWLVGRTAKQLAVMNREVDRARRMGSYQLEEMLGKGGMGEVWRARHEMLRRPAAVKLIQPENLGLRGPESAHLLVRFEREAQATAGLHSPHTIQLYDFGATEEGSFYYVMELLDGFDLDTLVKRFGPQSWQRTARMLLQACDSLDDAHRSGMIHRDIKPANIYLCRYGHKTDFVKVLDFGLVKHSGGTAGGDATLTAATAIAGTPAFVSPEAARGEAIDGRADLYSLGCVAYWLLTGCLVFDRDTPMQTVIAHIQEEPPPISSCTELDVPAAFEEIVMDCLRKNPEERPRSAGELARRLETCGWESGWGEERAEAWWEKHSPPPAPNGEGSGGKERPATPSRAKR